MDTSASLGRMSVSDKMAALRQVVEEIEKNYGDCNEQVTKLIEQINILYTPSSQNILSTCYSKKERDRISSLSNPYYLEMYRQLCHLLEDVDRKRNHLASTMYQKNPTMSQLYEFLESTDTMFSNLVKKYSALLKSLESSS